MGITIRAETRFPTDCRASWRSATLRHHDNDAGYTATMFLVGHATGSGVANACACVSYFAAAGGTCGNQSSVTTSGIYTIPLDTLSGAGSWANTSEGDMPYIYMVLKPCTPSSSCTAFNTLRGYKMVRQ